MGQLGFGIVILPKSGKAECEALALLSYHKGQRGLVDRQVNKYGQQSGQYLLQFINFYFVDQSCSSRELAALLAGPLKCHQRLARNGTQDGTLVYENKDQHLRFAPAVAICATKH